jgi:hypothetical protein
MEERERYVTAIRELWARVLSVPVVPHPDDWFPQ